MENRIRHLLHDGPDPSVPTPRRASRARRNGPYPLPRGIGMLMPVELCINRELLITLLGASILEMRRHQRDGYDGVSEHARSQLEAALHQQLAFRAWSLDHPADYISIAIYPTTDADPTVEDFGDLGESSAGPT